MLSFLKIYLISLPIFFAVDLLWLGVIAKDLYGKYLGHLMAPSPNWPAAFAFYFLFMIGVTIFAIEPAVQKNSWQYAATYGALFGFFTYMTYELTNLAVLKDWPLGIVAIDIIWGIVLTASVSTLTFWAHQYFIG